MAGWQTFKAKNQKALFEALLKVKEGIDLFFFSSRSVHFQVMFCSGEAEVYALLSLSEKGEFCSS
jgi:hypothetical protein